MRNLLENLAGSFHWGTKTLKSKQIFHIFQGKQSQVPFTDDLSCVFIFVRAALFWQANTHFLSTLTVLSRWTRLRSWLFWGSLSSDKICINFHSSPFALGNNWTIKTDLKFQDCERPQIENSPPVGPNVAFLSLQNQSFVRWIPWYHITSACPVRESVKFASWILTALSLRLKDVLIPGMLKRTDSWEQCICLPNALQLSWSHWNPPVPFARREGQESLCFAVLGWRMRRFLLTL